MTTFHSLRSLTAAPIIAACALCHSGTACADRIDSIQWQATLNADFSSGPYNPFWLVSNRQGLSSVKKDNGYLRLSAAKVADESKRFSWGAAADIAVPWNFTSSFVIQQLYGEMHYRALDAMIGAKEMWGEISDPYLSTGNLLYSGNARPIPQVRLGIFDFADIWGLKGWLAVKGYLSYGFFTDSHWQESWVGPDGKYSKNVLFCSRGLWLRNGNPDKFPLTFEAGIEMGTEFGGTTYRPVEGMTKMPTNFKAFIKALVPWGGGSDTPDTEQTNVEGNMIGSWNFALNWTPKDKSWNAKVYYQHMFEDHSMLYIDYPWKDGLWGAEATLPMNPYINKVVYEFLYAKDQSGPVNWTVTPEVPGHAAGADAYYYHYLYTGWEHWGMGIGNAMSLSPVFNRPHDLRFLSTRIITHHLGLSGSPIPQLDWRLLLSYTRSWGTYQIPYPDVKNAFNSLVEVTWKPSSRMLKGWTGTLGLAMDRGDIVGHNYGMQLTITKTGWLKF